MFEIQEFSSLPESAPMDWGRLAEQFSTFVMDPANRVMFPTPEGYTAFTAFLQDAEYRTSRHELTSFGPIVLGKVLRGEDVSGLARSLEMFFDQQQRIFLNSPGRPRVEMWYLMNINALAAHLVLLTLNDDPTFTARWRQAADRLVELAQRVDYDFRHQGYNFAEDAPWTNKDIYRQPDALGGYAYLMLLAHTRFGDAAYLQEARKAVRGYLNLPGNPWYEIPMGGMAAAAAAYLSAAGEDVDAVLAVRHALDPQAGLVVGRWGGLEVNGLVRGWRYAEPESAYSMESLVLLPYLLPAVRRIPRLARVVGQYALHAAANMRLFYTGHVPYESRADLPDVVTYERLYAEYEGQAPYGAGDFAGHKSIYGGAYALWWGALIQPTEDPFILRLDLSKSDFLDPSAAPAYLYYNPYSEQRHISTPDGKISIPAREAVVIG
jgi:hypothetical protein